MGRNRCRADVRSTDDRDATSDDRTEHVADADDRAECVPDDDRHERVATVEREVVETALARLSARGDLTDEQRAAVADLAASIAAELEPTVVALERCLGDDRPDT